MNAEVLAFVLYFVLMLAIGVLFFFAERARVKREYFLGGRHMGPWVTAMSAQASDMSAWLLMGLPGFDSRLRLRSDLDRHRPCHRHDCQLDHCRAPAPLLLRGGERLHHPAAIFIEPFCHEEPDTADHLRGHFPRLLHDLCRLRVRLGRNGLYDGVPESVQPDGNASVRADYHHLRSSAATRQSAGPTFSRVF